jgi:hypothetical protein
MQRKSIFFVAVISAAMFVGIFINPTLVSITKNKTSNLTLERICSYTGEGENAVCCDGITLQQISTGCADHAQARYHDQGNNTTAVTFCCKPGTKDRCYFGTYNYAGDYRSSLCNSTSLLHGQILTRYVCK